MSVQLDGNEIVLKGISRKNANKLQNFMREVKGGLKPYVKEGIITKEKSHLIVYKFAVKICKVWKDDENSDSFKDATLYIKKINVRYNKLAAKKATIKNAPNLRVAILRHSYEKRRYEEQATSQETKEPKPILNISSRLIV